MSSQTGEHVDLTQEDESFKNALEEMNLQKETIDNIEKFLQRSDLSEEQRQEAQENRKIAQQNYDEAKRYVDSKKSSSSSVFAPLSNLFSYVGGTYASVPNKARGKEEKEEKEETRVPEPVKRLMTPSDDDFKPIALTREPFFPSSFGPLFPFEPVIRKKKPEMVKKPQNIAETVQHIEKKFGKVPESTTEKQEKEALKQALKAVVSAKH